MDEMDELFNKVKTKHMELQNTIKSQIEMIKDFECQLKSQQNLASNLSTELTQFKNKQAKMNKIFQEMK